MFREKKAASAVGVINTLLGDGSRFKGSVECEGTMRIDGKVDGKVLARGSVIVGETGIIKADIMAPDIVIGGKVTGNITAENKVELLPAAQLYGDIQTPILAIAEGVVFQGNCNMKGKVEPKVEPKEKVKAEGEAIEVKQIKE
ncbi:polymer-forming cytoskeletal protein [bacterium]|nr:polymer-forming cytoskeletal protein [bacterium]